MREQQALEVGAPTVNRGYESIYRGLQDGLRGCDLAEAADRLGLDFGEGPVRLRFLARDYRITGQGVAALDGRPVQVNVRNVLLSYLLSRGRGEPENDYVLFESLPALAGGLAMRSRLMDAPLEQCFGDDFHAFSQAATQLGGREEGADAGSHRWHFAVLPKIHLRIVFQEADEDFPVAIRIMPDRSALRFLEFEALAFLVGCLVHACINFRDGLGEGV